MPKASTIAQSKYKAKAYDRIEASIPKGRKADIKEYCERQNTTPNALINELLRYELGMTPAQWKQRQNDDDV